MERGLATDQWVGGVGRNDGWRPGGRGFTVRSPRQAGVSGSERFTWAPALGVNIAWELCSDLRQVT